MPYLCICISDSVSDTQKSRKERQKKQLANQMKCFNVLTAKMPGNVALISQQSRKGSILNKNNTQTKPEQGQGEQMLVQLLMPSICQQLIKLSSTDVQF